MLWDCCQFDNQKKRNINVKKIVKGLDKDQEIKKDGMFPGQQFCLDMHHYTFPEIINS